MIPARIARAGLIVVAAAGLGACSLGGLPHDKTEGFSSATCGPVSPRAVSYNQTAPKGGGYYMVGDPYRIAGKTYIPQENPAKTQVGVASWYGEDFNGLQTANGEVYDLDGVTAASPTMPLPSYARVTNLENGKSIEVRVNDRGPFADNRIMDVSRTVARKLDFEDEGTANVRVDYIGPAPLDGNDTPMLLASYNDPGATPALGRGALIQIAAGLVPAAPVAPPIPVAPPRSAPVSNRTGDPDRGRDDPWRRRVRRSRPRATDPDRRGSLIRSRRRVKLRRRAAGDPIAPLILRAGLSYATPAAATAPLTPAEKAAEQLAQADLSSQLATIAAAKRAAELEATRRRLAPDRAPASRRRRVRVTSQRFGIC